MIRSHKIRKITSAILALLVIMTTFVVQPIAVSAEGTPSVNLSVDTTNVMKELDIKALGTNVAISDSSDKWTGAAIDPKYKNLIENVSPGILRFPAGSEAEEIWFDTTNSIEWYKGYDNCTKVLRADMLDKFIALCRSIGAEPMLVLPIRPNHPDNAASIVQYCKDKGYNVKYYEFGNEPEYWGGAIPEIPNDQWIERFNILYDKVKAIDPNVIVNGPTVAQPHNYITKTQPLLKGIADGGRKIDVISQHWYQLWGDCPTPEESRYPSLDHLLQLNGTVGENASNAGMAWPDTFIGGGNTPGLDAYPNTEIVDNLFSYRDLYAPGATISMSEIGAVTSQGNGTVNTQVGAVWLGDELGRLFYDGVDYIQQFQFTQSTSYSLINNSSKMLVPRPQYYTYYLYNKYFTSNEVGVNSKIFKTSTSDAQNMSIWAAQNTSNPDMINLFIINKSQASNLSATVDLGGFIPNDTAIKWVVSASGVTETDTTINGYKVKEDGTFAPGGLYEEGISSSFTKTFPAHSVTVLQLTRQGTQVPELPTPQVNDTPKMGEEMLSNTCFEFGISPWTGSGATLTQSAEYIHKGMYSLEVSGRESSGASPNLDITSVLNSQGAGRYNMSAWVRLASGTDKAQMKLKITDDTGTNEYATSFQDVNSDGFTQILGSIKIQKTGTITAATLYIQTESTTTTMYVDDCSMANAVPVPLPPPSTGEMLTNTGFETEGDLTPWTGNGATLSQDTFFRHTGTFSVLVSERIDGLASAYQDVTAQLESQGAGTYNVGAWVKLASGTDKADISLKVTDDNGTNYYRTNVWKDVNKDEFTFVSGSITVPEGGIITEANFYVQTQTNAVMYLDDCTMANTKPLPIQTPGEKELLSNASFEDGVSPWTGNGATITQNAFYKHGGSYSAKLTRAASFQGPYQDVTEQIKELGAGKYNVSAWVMLDSGSENAEITMRLITSAGTNYIGANINKPVNSTSFTQLSGSINVTIPAGATIISATYYVQTGSTGVTMYVDDCSMTRPPLSPPPTATGELLYNTSFENGTTYWTSNGATITSNSIMRHRGTKSVEVSDRAADWGSVTMNIGPRLSGKGAGTYNVRAWVRMQSGIDKADIVLKTTINGVTDYLRTNVWKEVNSTEFTEISGTITVPAGTISGAYFYIQTKTNTTMYVDDCSIAKFEAIPLPTPVVGEILTNTSFEDSITPWTGNGATVTQNSYYKHGGYYSTKFERVAGFQGPNQDVTEKLRELGSGVYNVGAWVLLDSGTDKAEITVMVEDDSGTHYYGAGIWKTVNTSGFTQLSGSIDINIVGTLKLARYYVQTQLPGIMYVDDCTMANSLIPTEAVLSDLNINAGTLTPSFDTNKGKYTATVPTNVKTINVTAIAKHPEAMITIKESQQSGVISKDVDLAFGANIIDVVVTMDNHPSRTYTITVTREGTEILVNTDFEKGISPWTGNGATITQNSIYMHGGSYSAECVRAANYQGPNQDITEQLIKYGPGKYNVGAWVRLASGTDAAEITVKYLDDSSTTDTDYKYIGAGINKAVNSNGFTQLSGSINISPVGTLKKAIIYLQTTNQNASPTMYVDDFTMKVDKEPILSNDANLSLLTVNAGTLSPVFDTNTTAYSVNVANEVSSIGIAAATADSKAVISINGTAVANGEIKNLNLEEGQNTVAIVVTAEDGTVKTYTVIVNRAAPIVKSNNANLSGVSISAGTLHPEFRADKTSYKVNVGRNISSIALIAVTADSNATITINGKEQESSKPATIGLNFGKNTIKIVVIAEDGTQKTYTIVVRRHLLLVNPPAEPSEASLDGLTISKGTLLPAFDADKALYAAVVTKKTSSINVIATATDSNATITIDGSAQASGEARTVNLNVGNNTIKIVVTWEDGSQKTYTVIVLRLKI